VSTDTAALEILAKGTPKRTRKKATPVPETPDIVEKAQNIIWIGGTGFEADWDQVVVLQDEFRSGLECPVCLDKDVRMVSGNKQVSFISCPECAGMGRRPKAGNAKLTVKCSDCEGVGSIPCPACGGTGGKDGKGIVIPDSAKGMPKTGEVVSIGPKVEPGRYEIGMRVMYPSFAGHLYTVKKRTATGTEEVALMFLNQTSIISRLHGMLEFRDMKVSRALYTNE
jgi:co-chaperonin GroES (HSP10)